MGAVGYRLQDESPVVKQSRTVESYLSRLVAHRDSIKGIASPASVHNASAISKHTSEPVNSHLSIIINCGCFLAKAKLDQRTRWMEALLYIE